MNELTLLKLILQAAFIQTQMLKRTTVFFSEGDFTHQGRCGDELRAGEHFER